MKICIVTPTLMPHDAIGNDLRHQCGILNNKIQTKVFAENFLADEFTNEYMISRSKLFKLIDNINNILIYHHAVSWDLGQEILEDANCKIYIKYHNISYPDFFYPYSALYAEVCKNGREQTKKIVSLNKVNKYLCDSNFNAQDILELGVNKENIEIVAPFHKLDDFNNTKVDTSLTVELLKGQINILFVGRFSPNKGHKHLIHAIDFFSKMYDRNICLNIVGGLDTSLNAYINEMKALILQFGLEDIIKIHDQISFEQLHTYYQFSHIFLLMSEHEGFCVPILEAQIHNLPIIALNTTAILETIGENQIIFDELDYSEIASAIYVIAKNYKYRYYLGQNGQNNLRHYSNKKIENTLLKALRVG